MTSYVEIEMDKVYSQETVSIPKNNGSNGHHLYRLSTVRLFSERVQRNIQLSFLGLG